MEKNEVSEKQLELKTWLKKIGLSQNEFAAIFLLEHDDNCTEDEIKKFQGSFKKQLNRASTKVEALEKYLDYLFSIEKFKEAGYFRPKCSSKGILDPVAEKMMRKISRELSDKFEREIWK